MILTPIAPDAMPRVLDVFAASVRDHALARIVFDRIARTRRLCPGLVADLHQGRDKAVALAARLGIATLDEAPSLAFSWDGHCVRTASETSVVFHEIAHWQICPPWRRSIPDFGLGAGPESGRAAEADAAACVDAATREQEEALSSLLGILWEVEHEEPALLAFAEQNWLEGYAQPGAATHFIRNLAALAERGVIGADGHPRA